MPFHPRPQEAEEDRSVSVRLFWSTKHVWEQQGLHRETLSNKKKKKNLLKVKKDKMRNTAGYGVQHYRPRTQETEAGEVQSWGPGQLALHSDARLLRKRLETGRWHNRHHFLQKAQFNPSTLWRLTTTLDSSSRGPTAFWPWVLYACSAQPYMHIKHPHTKQKKLKKKKKWQPARWCSR